MLYLKLITLLLFLLMVSPFFAYLWSKMARLGRLAAEQQFINSSIKIEKNEQEKTK